MTDPQNLIATRIVQAAQEAFGPDFASVDPMVAASRNPQFGDYQANVAMSLAKQVGQNPRKVAEAIVERLQVGDIAEPPQIAGPGFINFKLTAAFIGRAAGELAHDDRLGVAPVDQPQRVVVDYSGPNVAKEMHVGHLRSTVIGDAIARTLEFLGHDVIRQNHMGDWGTQFGMLIEFMIDSGGAAGQSDIGDLNRFYQQAKKRFDEDPQFAERARRRVVALQSGDQQTLALWRQLVEISKHHFEALYQRLDVTLTDDHIRPESFYNPLLAAVVEDLRAQGFAKSSQDATVVFSEHFKTPEGEPAALIIQKSDGGYLYATTDLAALRYRVSDLGATRLIYVTDARQRQHFAMVFETARRAGWAADAVRLDHVPFGTILGENNRPFKTRTGDTVKLADLLDEAEERAERIVAEKAPEASQAERRQIAHIVGIGAVKYADLASDRVKDYVFSWDRMLAMEGNTAPYVQYAYARIRSIFRKALDAEGTTELPGRGEPLTIEHPAERALVLKLVQFDSVVRSVAQSLEPHRLCNYIFELATAFSSFFENCPVLRAESTQQRASRLALCDLTARTLHKGLDLLGIGVLERM